MVSPWMTRRVKTPTKGWTQRQEPCFPGYLFAQFDLTIDWRRISQAQGIAGLVRFNNHVPRLDPALIEDLKSLEYSITAEDRSKTLSLSKGDAVEITTGPLAGLTAKVYSLDRKERVHLLLDLLGSKAIVQRDDLIPLKQ